MPNPYEENRALVYMKSPIVREIHAAMPNRLWSEFVNLLIRASKLNKDEADRELAKRELDLFLEKIGA